jgi:poly(A) polymerase
MVTRRQKQTNFIAPDNAAEEFAAALEASTGKESRSFQTTPMTGAEIKQALDELLMNRRPDRGLEALVRSGVMHAVLPEVAALVGFGEGIRHKDVWEHTKKVVLQSPQRLEVRWAALLHDIGKVATRRFEKDGQVTFIGHPEVGARMFGQITRRLPMDEALRTRVRFLIAFHLRAAAYKEDWTESAVRRFSRDMGDALEDLLDLSRADITSKYAEKVRRGIRQIILLAERVAQVNEIDARPAPLPKGLGTAIIEHFSIAPGPILGRIMSHLADKVEAGHLEVQREYSHYVTYLEDNKSVLEST